MEGYCLKCRATREMLEPQNETLRNGRMATKGICPICRTIISRLTKSPAGGQASNSE